MRRLQFLVFLSAFLALPQFLEAAPVIINFDALTDSEMVTNQFPGLVFSNTIALTAGISLNDFDFPPHSGGNVVSDDGGAISISFGTPVLSFGGYFTYSIPLIPGHTGRLVLEAFDASNTLLTSSLSAFSENYVSSGIGSPNEFVEVSFPGGISSVTITGDPGGGSFALDDATYSPASVPEPGTITLLLVGGVALMLTRSRLPGR